jgi:hypothetical protein
VVVENNFIFVVYWVIRFVMSSVGEAARKYAHKLTFELFMIIFTDRPRMCRIEK